MRTLKTFCLLIVILAVHSAASANSRTTIPVCPICTHTTVSSALGAASAGDVISINRSTHTEANVNVKKDVTVIGGTVDTIWRAASAPNSGTGRVMSVEAGHNVTVRNLTFMHGDTTEDGGGIFNAGALTLENVGFERNSANKGGGIALISGSSLNAHNVALSENSAERGGALSNIGATVTITNSSITTNTAALGGGIYQNFGNFTIEDSTLRANIASSNGGAVDHNGGNLTVRNALVRDNYANFGGALSTASGNLFVVGSQVISNDALYQGGAIFGSPYARISVTQESEISNNSTTSGSGGGIYHTGESLLVSSSVVNSNQVGGANSRGAGIFIFDGGNATIAFSTIGGNIAQNGGGGIAFSGSEADDTLKLSYSLLFLNSAGTNKEGGAFLQTQGGGVDIVNTTLSSNIGRSQLHLLDGALTLTHATVYNGFGGGLKRDAGTLTLQNSIVAGNSGTECDGTITIPASAPNLASDSSCGASIVNSSHGLEPLTDNGGLTNTHMPASDSPAINAASTAICNLDIVSGADQRYYPRPYGPACDLGAVERSTGTPTAVQLTTMGASSLEISWIMNAMLVLLSGSIVVQQRRMHDRK